MVVKKEDIINALENVMDPEIGLNVVDMGLIYGVSIDGNKVEVKMTLTTPGCPLAAMLVDKVGEAVSSVPGVTKTEVKLVWDPPWTPEMMKNPKEK
ncbi:MAG: DUF59 domain-containing protein [Candidatus Diapherotrites archaeon]|nr:DUF59 domain-containing protein [Candidatus Diapherotrites archaeon]